MSPAELADGLEGMAAYTADMADGTTGQVGQEVMHPLPLQQFSIFEQLSATLGAGSFGKYL